MKTILRSGLLLTSLCGLLFGVIPSASAITYPLVVVDLDGRELATRGLLLNGHTLLPVRDLAVNLRGDLAWDAHSKTLWAGFPVEGKTVRMTVDSPMATLYQYDASHPRKTGAVLGTMRLRQPPVLLAGHVVAPVAAIGVVAGAKVFWEPETKKVLIQT